MTERQTTDLPEVFKKAIRRQQRIDPAAPPHLFVPLELFCWRCFQGYSISAAGTLGQCRECGADMTDAVYRPHPSSPIKKHPAAKRFE